MQQNKKNILSIVTLHEEGITSLSLLKTKNSNYLRIVLAHPDNPNAWITKDFIITEKILKELSILTDKNQ